MPRRVERRGFAYHHAGHHQAFRDGIGHVYRTGAAVFGRVAFEWKIGKEIQAGKAPSRLQRLFMYEDDDDDGGEERLMLEQNWFWNYKMIAKVPKYDEHIDEAVLEEMRLDPRKYLEGDLSTCEEFEALVSDASVFRQTHADAMHPADSDSFIKMGNVCFEIDENDGTVVNEVIGWTRWAASESLEASAPLAVRQLVTKPTGVQPCSADDRSCHLRSEEPLSGGPELPHIAEGETLKKGANDWRIFGFEYVKGGITSRAYAIGDLHANPLTAVELLTHAELAASRVSSEATKRLLRVPRAKRVYAAGDPAHELIVGHRTVKVRHASITKLIIVASPALLEGLQLHFAPDTLFSFELVQKHHGGLVACQRLSESLARHLTRVIILPQVASTRTFILYSLQEALIERFPKAGEAINPMVTKMSKVPFAYVLAIPGLHKWKRSSANRHVLVRIFEGDDDADETLGFLAWHAPKGKEENFYNKISVPIPKTHILRAPTVTIGRSVNYMSYDTETQELKFVTSITRFNGSKRVSGATIDARDASAGDVYKLGKGWVASAVRAPSMGELRRVAPGGPSWAVF